MQPESPGVRTFFGELYVEYNEVSTAHSHRRKEREGGRNSEIDSD